MNDALVLLNKLERAVNQFIDNPDSYLKEDRMGEAFDTLRNYLQNLK